MLVTPLDLHLVTGVMLLVVTLMLGITSGATVLVTLLGHQLVLLQGLVLDKGLRLGQRNSVVEEDKFGRPEGSTTQSKVWGEHLSLGID